MDSEEITDSKEALQDSSDDDEDAIAPKKVKKVISDDEDEDLANKELSIKGLFNFTRLNHTSVQEN